MGRVTEVGYADIQEPCTDGSCGCFTDACRIGRDYDREGSARRRGVRGEDMRIWALKTNHLTNPVGCDTKSQVLSWRSGAEDSMVAEGGTASTEPLSVRLQISGDMDFPEEALLYDSADCGDGRNREPNGRAFCPPLACQARKRYYWRVMVQEAERISVSGTAYWETGKGREPWQARWIQAPFDPDIHPVFRRKFYLSERPRRVRIYAAACGIYEITLNGHKVGEEYLSPGYYAYDLWTQYQTWEADGLTVQGENEIRVEMGPGWYKGRFGYDGFHENIYGDRMLFLGELILSFEDGHETVIGTGPDWEAAYGNVTFSNIYDGEIYDARIRQERWQPAELAAMQDKELTERRNPPIRIRERLSPAAVLYTPAGETVLDFGQEVTGWVEFPAALPEGHWIKLRFGEILQDGCFFNENYRTAKARFCYCSDGGERMVRPRFTFFGFRYVKVEGMEEGADFGRWMACCVRSDLEETGDIKTGHEGINRLFLNALWGQRGNFLDVPTDCPQRDERMGWTGDAQIFSGAACYNMDCAAFYDKFMTDLGLEQGQAAGAVPTVVPIPKYMAKGDSFGNQAYGISPWSDAAVIIPWNLYLHYGDKGLLRRHYASMKSWTDYITRVDGLNGRHCLWTTGFHYGDWLALDNKEDPQSPFGATDVYFVASAYYYIAAAVTGLAAGELGLSADASGYGALAADIRQAFLEKYFGQGKIAVDTQTGLSMALVLGLYPEGMEEALARRLVEKLHENGDYLETGFVGTYFLLPALVKAGADELAYTVLLNEDYPGWLYAVRMGATTIWERWNSVREDGRLSDRQMNSLNHYAYGSVVEWLYRYGAGIAPKVPGAGFSEFDLAPHPDRRLGFLRASLEAACGRIESAWEYGEEGVRYQFLVPPGANACLYLPHRKLLEAWQNGSHMDVSEGRETAEGIRLCLMPGHYGFLCR